MSSRQTVDNARETGDFYAAMQHNFGWSVPANFNMAQVCSQRWAAQPYASQRTAIIEHQVRGAHRSYSFAQLQRWACKEAIGSLLFYRNALRPLLPISR